jgi:hypothetical protein
MIHDVDLYEPIRPGVTADSLTPSADSLTPTADGGILEDATDLNDAVVNADFHFQEIFEPIHPGWTADSIAVTADALEPTADGGPLEPASDALDATVIAAGAVVIIEPASAADTIDADVVSFIQRYGAFVRPPAVVGVGYGVLPRLEGEAFGVVGVAGDGGVTLQLVGAAHGEVDDDLELELALLILLAA